MAARKAWAWILAVLAVASAGTALVLDHQRLDSATMDEPFHALASAEYAMRGTYFANLEHPPLAKLLSGPALEVAGARAPRFTTPFEMRTAEQPFPFCYGNTIPSGRLFAAARSPFP
ncbi:MAG TPA: hypothetical protein VGR00_05935, partial [Thermoanaerobaculia bacterium]|nr:hypothetical protein [Thermoanaerobaculia bacterium]